jgi:hypothetical protein
MERKSLDSHQDTPWKTPEFSEKEGVIKHIWHSSNREKYTSIYLVSSRPRMLYGSYRTPIHQRRPSTNKIPVNHNSRTVDSKMLEMGYLFLFIVKKLVA